MVGEIDRRWSAKRHRLNGRPAIKISLKIMDANEARSRWATIHAQGWTGWRWRRAWVCQLCGRRQPRPLRARLKPDWRRTARL